MKLAHAVLILLLSLALAGAAAAAVTSSAFDNFVYSYSVTPAPGEDLRSFHVYTSLTECDASHYYDLVLPAGWSFTTVERPVEGDCVLTFWTEGEPLPADQAAAFGFVHYCAPCCHSWYVSDAGTSDPAVTEVDSDANHSEPCNIPAEFGANCGGPGLLLAPIYPVSVAEDAPAWGSLKAQYR